MKTIELHILQNFPPSNLNRDDLGNPKECQFGGYPRQRISSQCLKRAVRELFKENEKLALAFRTKKAPGLVATKLQEAGMSNEQAHELAVGLLGLLHGSDEEETKIILNYGDNELAKIARYITNNESAVRQEIERIGGLKNDALKKAKLALAGKIAAVDANKPQTQAVDVALFGRMLATSPTERVDAACQVSHAISVNRFSQEYDYFTAVDDLQPNGETGANMIGTIGFASSCFYRFACVNMALLTRNLGGNQATAYQAALAFAEAFVQARPSGKQNTFAAHSLPALVLVVTRESGQPVSLVNAFEMPVRPSEQRNFIISLTTGAIGKLGHHYAKLNTMYELRGLAAFVTDEPATGTELEAAGAARQASVPALLRTLRDTLTASPV